MPSSLVGGSVDNDLKKRVDSLLKRKGVTQTQVIRFVWNSIAKTGKVPGVTDGEEVEGSLQERFRALRAATPRSEHLEKLTPKALKEELANRG